MTKAGKKGGRTLSSVYCGQNPPGRVRLKVSRGLDFPKMWPSAVYLRNLTHHLNNHTHKLQWTLARSRSHGLPTGKNCTNCWRTQDQDRGGRPVNATPPRATSFVPKPTKVTLEQSGWSGHRLRRKGRLGPQKPIGLTPPRQSQTRVGPGDLG